MSEMIERVAKALHAEDSGDAWEEATSYAKAMHSRAARAAIAAMREPTAAMVDAGYKAVDPDDEFLPFDAPATGWKAMIDEALAPRGRN